MIPFHYYNFFVIERCLLMIFYHSKGSGLSEWAFRRYIVLCSDERFYNEKADDPCVYNAENYL